MSRKMIGVGFIILGVVVLLVSLAADALGIGNVPGFGWKQILGAVVGAVAALGGAWLVWRKRDLKK